MAVIDLTERPCECGHPREKHPPRKHRDEPFAELVILTACVVCPDCFDFEEMHDNLVYVEYLQHMRDQFDREMVTPK